MQYFQQNLNHMAEPASPAERQEAVNVRMKDWVALWFTEALREFAHYHAPSDEHRDVALGYVEFIDEQVRERGNGTVSLYTHTALAADVLIDALDVYHEENRDNENSKYPIGAHTRVEPDATAAWAEFYDK